MKNLLASKGMKVTRPRLAVLSVLNKASFPLTADAIYEKLGDEKINLSTVYRTLNMFAEAGLVKKEVNDEKENVFSLESDEDSHVLVCVKCHKKEKLEGCPYHEANEQIEEQTGFSIIDHSTEIYGICPECRKKES